MKFMKRVILDDNEIERVLDEEVETWHNSNYKISLSEHLGMTKDEYHMFVVDPKKFSQYFKEKHEKAKSK